MRLRRLLALSAVAATVGVLSAVAGVAVGDITPGATTATPRITRAGVGAVRLGRTYRALRHDGLVGRIRHGCELGGPNTRSASLRSPLRGSVNFTLTTPRRVTDVQITGGAKARGVGIGGRTAQIKAAYPKAKVDHSTDDTFEFTLVRVPRSGGGRIAFAVSTKTHKVILIGVPQLAVCE